MTTAESLTQVCIPLESGDRLTRAEFERRYTARPDIKKAELIEGVVYVASPVRIREHAQPHADVIFWLGGYRMKHPDCWVADNGTVRLDADNEPQPDAMLIRDGGPRLDRDGYLAGPPELAVEISASSASQDLGAKMNVYRRNGVQEYVVWQIFEGRIDWFQLFESVYEAIVPNESGIVESAVFPGLRLDVAAMLSGDSNRVLAALANTSASR